MALDCAALVSEAKRLALRSQRSRAAALFRQVLERVPEQPEALYGLARLAYGAGDSGQAIALLERLLRVQPVAAEPWFDLGMICYASGRHAQAAAAFRRLGELQPDHPRVHFHHGLALLELGPERVEQAIAAFRRALALDDDFTQACGSLAAALVAAGREDEAETYYRRLQAAEA